MVAKTGSGPQLLFISPKSLVIRLDSFFGRVKKRHTRLLELDSQQNIEIDVAGKIMRMSRDIFQSYMDASPVLKRLYLGLFWDMFQVADGVIIKSHPSVLFVELLKLQQIFYSSPKTKNPQSIGDSGNTELGIIRNFWLARRVQNHPLDNPKEVSEEPGEVLGSRAVNEENETNEIVLKP